MNAIDSLVLSSITFPVLLNGVFGVKDLFFNGLVDVGMAPKMASALWAFLYMFICFIPAYILYKKKIKMLKTDIETNILIMVLSSP